MYCKPNHTFLSVNIQRKCPEDKMNNPKLIYGTIWNTPKFLTSAGGELSIRIITDLADKCPRARKPTGSLIAVAWQRL